MKDLNKMARPVMTGTLIVIAMILPLAALAQSTYYSAFFELGDASASGYAALDQHPDGRVVGKLCAYDDMQSLGTINIEGVRRSNTLIVKFAPDQKAARTKLKTILPTNAITLIRTTEKPDYNLGNLLGQGPGWQTKESGDEKPYFNFVEVRSDLGPEPQDRYARLSGARSTKFDLMHFDGLSPQQAFSLTLKTKWDEVIAPGTVHLIYKPSERKKISQFLTQFGNLVQFEGPAPPDCGAPFVEDTIDVYALLEFYFARRLQASGLVARAYPEELPRTPPFTPVPVRATELSNVIKDESHDFDERFVRIGAFFDAQLQKFVAEKRPRFQGPWQVTLKKSGSRAVYRWEVVGASISSCKRSGWEKFDIQIALTLSDRIEVSLQVVEAYQAPGSLAERPPDARFKDNPLTDEQMQKIQDGFYDFLVRQGVVFKNPDFPIVSTITTACKL
jgi:hypothetical protein